LVETPEHRNVRDSIRRALGPWRRFIIAIDGVDAAGKSTLARYLAWQLGIPAIETDLFLDKSAGGLTYRLEELKRVVDARLSLDRPGLVEGVRVLHTLRLLGLSHDFLVWVEQDGHDGSHALGGQLSSYTNEFSPRDRANVIFSRPSDDSDGLSE
jgi:hypothetical protein